MQPMLSGMSSDVRKAPDPKKQPTCSRSNANAAAAVIRNKRDGEMGSVSPHTELTLPQSTLIKRIVGIIVHVMVDVDVPRLYRSESLCVCVESAIAYV